MTNTTIVEACSSLGMVEKGDYVKTHPSTYSVDATYSRAEDFTSLLGVKHAPFVRKDGTICTKPGYDPDSKMFLYPSEDLKEGSVPEKPTKKQGQEARAVVEDWLVDFREMGRAHV